MSACCSPARTGPGAPAPVPRVAGGPRPALVDLDGGDFRMGSADPGAYADDGEGPVRTVTLSPYAVAPTTVTIADFAAFVDATGHRTTSERLGASFVFAGLLPDDAPPTRGVADAPWWREVAGADWAHPEGPWSGVDDRLDHPVTHVSWDDAVAYAEWVGGRLPTEAQWEHAARGGLDQRRFPWGNRMLVDGEHRMNVWQGRFPDRNTAADGFVGTAPANHYPPNDYGLHNTTGNVWEWVADRFSVGHDLSAAGRRDPVGPATGDRRVLRGGSYLCHASYCWRYRTSARMANTPDSASGNTGFRVAG